MRFRSTLDCTVSMISAYELMLKSSSRTARSSSFVTRSVCGGAGEERRGHRQTVVERRGGGRFAGVDGERRRGREGEDARRALLRRMRSAKATCCTASLTAPSGFFSWGSREGEEGGQAAASGCERRRRWRSEPSPAPLERASGLPRALGVRAHIEVLADVLCVGEAEDRVDAVVVTNLRIDEERLPADTRTGRQRAAEVDGCRMWRRAGRRRGAGRSGPRAGGRGRARRQPGRGRRGRWSR